MNEVALLVFTDNQLKLHPTAYGYVFAFRRVVLLPQLLHIHIPHLAFVIYRRVKPILKDVKLAGRAQ